jgi:hypothetical protein
MRISELREYSTRDVSSVTSAREVAADYVPNAAAAQALTRRNYTNGLALTETGPQRLRERIHALGELVQVVT